MSDGVSSMSERNYLAVLTHTYKPCPCTCYVARNEYERHNRVEEEDTPPYVECVMPVV